MYKVKLKYKITGEKGWKEEIWTGSTPEIAQLWVKGRLNFLRNICGLRIKKIKIEEVV